MKSNSDVRPPCLLDLGNGSWHYNYNITEVETPAEPTEQGDDTAEPAVRVSYNYDTVLIWGAPNADKCIKAVLRDRRDETEEFNLINKYNSFVVGISTDENDKTEYEDYLREVSSVKAMVYSDLATK